MLKRLCSFVDCIIVNFSIVRQTTSHNALSHSPFDYSKHCLFANLVEVLEVVGPKSVGLDKVTFQNGVHALVV